MTVPFLPLFTGSNGWPPAGWRIRTSFRAYAVPDADAKVRCQIHSRHSLPRIRGADPTGGLRFPRAVPSGMRKRPNVRTHASGSSATIAASSTPCR